MPQEKVDQSNREWWEDKEFIEELDYRYNALVSGEDKGVTLQEFQDLIEKRKQNKDRE